MKSKPLKKIPTKLRSIRQIKNAQTGKTFRLAILLNDEIITMRFLATSP